MPRIWPTHSATRVAGHDQRVRTSAAGDGPSCSGDVGGLLPGQPRDHFAGRFAAADAALGGAGSAASTTETCSRPGQATCRRCGEPLARINLAEIARGHGVCLAIGFGRGLRQLCPWQTGVTDVRTLPRGICPTVIDDPPPSSKSLRGQSSAGRQQAAGLADDGRGGRRNQPGRWPSSISNAAIHKPGNVYLGVVSRLDTGTSGVVMLARTSKAAARLTEQFRSREVQKTYWAIVAGTSIRPAGELVDWVDKDEARQRMAIVPSDASGRKGGPAAVSDVAAVRRRNAAGNRAAHRPQTSDSAATGRAGVSGVGRDGSMARRRPFAGGLPCTPGGWCWSIRCGASRWNCVAPVAAAPGASWESAMTAGTEPLTVGDSEPGSLRLSQRW